jgi:hypothetical protein
MVSNDRRVPHGEPWQSGAQVAGFGLSIPVFFLTSYAWVLWFAVPLLAGRLRRSRRRNPDRPRAT